MTLLPEHAEKYLRASAISDQVAGARDYWSAVKPGDLNGRFTGVQKRTPGLVIRVLDVSGKEAFCQLRPDDPRVDRNGKPIKYETPRGARMVIDVPPAAREHLGNPAVPLWITEGVRKGDALVSAGLCAVALLGVDNWRGTNSFGGKAALPDWEDIALNGRRVILAFDSDAWTNPDVHRAIERFGRYLLERRGAEVRFLYLPSNGSKVGVDDYLAAGHSKDELVALVSPEWRPLPSDTRAREEKPSVPAPPTVELLEEVRSLITRYVVLPSEAAADLLALWTLHTWAFDAAWATLYLRITSAAPECGKTQLMEVLAAICRRGWHAVNPSTAVLYRKIDNWAPTLLLDELDNYAVDERRDALAVLNAGYKRGATVDRCKDNGELEQFEAFCPKAFAGLDSKAFVDTLLSRSATIRLERKARSESVERWIAPLTAPSMDATRERCLAWAAANVKALSRAHPQSLLALEIRDRAVEGWWALFAIAELAGDDWLARAQEAVLRFSSVGDEFDQRGDQEQLLFDIREAFGDEETIFTEVLLDKLNAVEESPWGSLRRGEGLDARGLAKRLRPFKIKPRRVRVGAVAGNRGYHVDQFLEAFVRYLPQDPSQAPQAPHAPHPNAHGTGDVADVADVADTEGASEQTQQRFDCACEGWTAGVGYPPVCQQCGGAKS